MQRCGLSVLSAPVDAEIVAPVNHLFYLAHTLVYVHHVVLVRKACTRYVESPHRISIAHSGGDVIIPGKCDA